MNDKEKLKALLKEFGIEYKTIEQDLIRCEEGDKKVKGYGCFYTDFVFDNDGKFIEMGAYE